MTTLICPPGGTLVKRDLQLFMKRLRKKFGVGIRFYGCGEYGEKFGRPHYHVLLFNRDMPDKVFRSEGKRGDRLYTSKVLSELWPMGHSVVGEVSFDSCAYVARYVMKKIFGKYADILYGDMVREFAVMSRKPGIGRPYFDKYGGEVYAHDSVVVNGQEVKPPRFYDNVLGSLDSVRLAEIKRRRQLARWRSPSRLADNTRERLAVREAVALAKLNLKGRVL